jgi:hypothetical protein
METIKTTADVTSIATWNAIIADDMVSLDNLNSAGIVAELKPFGITQVREVAQMIAADDNGYIKSTDGRVYEFPYVAKPGEDTALGTALVADTNGDPVWQGNDEAEFADLLADYDLSL